MQLKEQKYKAIRRDFDQLSKQGKYTLQYILQQLSNQYYLKPDTIYRIVRQMHPYNER
jgi:hypothetical protein